MAALVLISLCLFEQSSSLAEQLPPGAEVGIWKLSPKATSPAEAQERMSGEVKAPIIPGQSNLKIVFYSLPNPTPGCSSCRASFIDVQEGSGATVWRHPITDPLSGNLISSRFYDPTGAHELLKSGRPMIVSFAYIGASAGGILNIFRWNGSYFEDVSGPWNINEQVDGVRFEGVDGDGNKEVIIEHHTTNSVSRFGPRTVYRWNGRRYERQGLPPRVRQGVHSDHQYRH